MALAKDKTLTDFSRAFWSINSGSYFSLKRTCVFCIISGDVRGDTALAPGGAALAPADAAPAPGAGALSETEVASVERLMRQGLSRDHALVALVRSQWDPDRALTGVGSSCPCGREATPVVLIEI